MLSAAERTLGNTIEAHRAIDRASTRMAGLGNHYLDALINAERGRIALVEGDHSAAEQQLHTALAMQVRLGARPTAARTLEALATIAARDEGFAESARVLSAVETYREAMGAWPALPPRHASTRRCWRCFVSA